MIVWLLRIDFAVGLTFVLVTGKGEFLYAFRSLLGHEQASLLVVACAATGLMLRLWEQKRKRAKLA